MEKAKQIVVETSGMIAFSIYLLVGMEFNLASSYSLVNVGEDDFIGPSSSSLQYNRIHLPILSEAVHLDKPVQDRRIQIF